MPDFCGAPANGTAVGDGRGDIEQRSRKGDSRGDGEFLDGVDAIDEQKSEAGHGEERGSG